jgi:hypothetical protein
MTNRTAWRWYAVGACVVGLALIATVVVIHPFAWRGDSWCGGQPQTSLGAFFIVGAGLLAGTGLFLPPVWLPTGSSRRIAGLYLLRFGVALAGVVFAADAVHGYMLDVTPQAGCL